MATHQYHLNIDTQSTISAYCVPPVARRRGGDTVRPIVRSCAFRPFVTKKTARDFSPPINQPTNQPPATIQPTTSTLSVSAPMCAPARRRTVVGQRHDFVLYAQSAKQLYLINSSKTTIISGPDHRGDPDLDPGLVAETDAADQTRETDVNKKLLCLKIIS
ncbi:uncharacterized protein LOC109598264 isoform X1 [Aethina tumida]|uniref:uncharacterized protein LOC109598264 isoform X1 n=1 Tax=Aethina tumida TaxID=116153 RepID=UPI002148B09F|nr:uncharacterized protein LOC109598264 isoform X1 [Aethina tumida]